MNSTDELERQLDLMLHRRAGQAPLPALDVTGVRRRARRIQTRRGVAALTAVAAVVGVCVGVPYSLLDLRADDRPQISQSRKDGSGPAPGIAPTSIADLPKGNSPQVDWISGRTTLNVPEQDPISLRGSVAGDGFMGAGYSTQGMILSRFLDRSEMYADAELIKVSGDGAQTSLGPGSSSILSSDDGTTLVWWQRSDGLRRQTGGDGGGGTTVIKTPARTGVTPLGLLPDDKVAVTLSSETGDRYAVADPASGSLAPVTGLDDVSATDPVTGRMAGSVGSQGAVVSPDGRVLWRSPTWKPWSFSTGGQYLAAVRGLQPAGQRLGILNATTGKVLLTFDLGRLGCGTNEVQWESTDTVLAICPEGKEGSAVVRFGLDKQVELATRSASQIIFAHRR